MDITVDVVMYTPVGLNGQGEVIISSSQMERQAMYIDVELNK